MKKILGLLWAIYTSLVMAGGDVYPGISDVADIEAQTCENNKVYLEGHTNLMWQDESYGDTEDGAYARKYSAGKAGSWNHAVNYCSSLNYAGYSDWRLPTSDELSHVHRRRGQVFENFRGDDFWSSTPTTDTRYYVVTPEKPTPQTNKPCYTNTIAAI
jgi:hypothetical protein